MRARLVIAVVMMLLLGCRRPGGSTTSATGQEYPVMDTELAHCTMGPLAATAGMVDADVECVSKVVTQLGNVDAVVSDTDGSDRTLGQVLLQREDVKLAKGASKKYHLHVPHSAAPIGHRIEARLTATIRPDFDGKGDLGDFLDKLNADRKKNPTKYAVLVSRHGG